MPTSIPFDPSLVLGNIVPQESLDIVLKIAEAEGPVDAAEEAFNSAVMNLRSLDMTITELSNLDIDAKAFAEPRKQAEEAVTKTATDLATKRVASLAPISALRESIRKVNKSIESPIDYNRTEIKKMPLSADSLTMDAQYFSYDSNEQSSNSALAAISSFVSASTKFLGTKRSAEVTASVSSQVSQQREHHSVDGVLIITANCTHKDAALLAPLNLDVDKAIRVWNTNFAKGADKIKVDDPNSIMQIAKTSDTEAEQKMYILSGATYGSSFVGMVHVLKTEDTETSQKMMSLASSLQGQMEVGSWFASAQGGFGVNAQFANDVKNMLSTQLINSTVSVVTMGAIPSIKSNEVNIGVKQFADFDPAAMMGKLATLANATSSAQKSVQESAAAARTGGQMVQLRSAEIQSVLTGLGALDDGKNKMLDINSLMTAFEDYLDKVLAGNAGVPINYYLKPITASQLAQMWVNKYFPGEFLVSAGDDTPVTPPNNTPRT